MEMLNYKYMYINKVKYRKLKIFHLLFVNLVFIWMLTRISYPETREATSYHLTDLLNYSSIQNLIYCFFNSNFISPVFISSKRCYKRSYGKNKIIVEMGKMFY